jgi:hypothetical protein
MTAIVRPEQRDSFHLWTATALSGTVLVGFWFTYFGPIFRGSYPDVSPIVHVHGWSFFAWYALLTAQAGLIRSGHVALHRTLGFASIALAAIMIGVGLIVSTVRVHMALEAGGDPFWTFMGLPIFSIWVLFTAFYSAALVRRRRAAEHKRLMLLASAVALGAATFRIFVQVLGFTPWVAIVGTLAPIGFIGAAMIYDRRRLGSVHRVYVWGLTAILAVVGGAFVLGVHPGGAVASRGVAWVGNVLTPLYGGGG